MAMPEFHVTRAGQEKLFAAGLDNWKGLWKANERRLAGSLGWWAGSIVVTTIGFMWRRDNPADFGAEVCMFLSQLSMWTAVGFEWFFVYRMFTLGHRLQRLRHALSDWQEKMRDKSARMEKNYNG